MEIINCLVKFFGINICIAYSFYKIFNIANRNFKHNILILLSATILAILQTFLIKYTTLIFRLAFIFFLYSIFLSKILKVRIRYSIIGTIFSVAITYIFNTISSSILLLIIKFSIFAKYYYNPVTFALIGIINFLLIYLLYKTKRLKHGLPFLQSGIEKEFLHIFILVLCGIIIFTDFTIRLYLSIHTYYLIIGIVIFSIITFIILYKSFILYHKQKLQTQALKDYEKEIADTKAKLETALEEKQTLVKSNHEFYHRQEALNKKLNDLIEQQKIASNTEFANELTNISDRLNTLSSEYSAKTANKPKLVKCNIEEIDDMLSYMQLECIKNKIQFTANIDYNVNDLIGKFISKSQLETLLGDLIRNSIIAINHTNKEPREIMVVFGSRDKTYELAIFDTGIPFEISTLINLGLKPASTHLDEGGSGIGFITTFETLKDCKASFIINELSTGNYTKSLIVRFDGNCEYIITSARADEIAKANTIQRNIKIEPKDE